MLPKRLKTGAALVGLLLLCSSSSFEKCNAESVKNKTDELYGIFQHLPLNCNSCFGDECLTGRWNPRKCEGDINQDCMSVFDVNGEIRARGCQGIIEDTFAQHCEDYPEFCFYCKSNGCNVVEDPSKYQECLYCDSTSNADCLHNPSAVQGKRKCTEGCVSSLYLRKGTQTVQDFVRTCAEDIELDDRAACTAENNCVICNEPSCNTDILPVDAERLSCFHCEGDNCDEPVEKECSAYTQNDQCYIRFENVTHSVISMGCRSEFNKAELLAEIKELFICDGDNCNTYENLPPAHMCYVCDSEIDINCAVDPSKVKTVSRCQIYPDTTCFTRITLNGTTLRGCSYDLSYDNFIGCNSAEDRNCRICAESNCNGVIYPSRRQQCHRCNSLDNTDCETAPNNKQACPLYQTSDTCTTKIENGITMRGCSSEFDCKDANYKSCRTCYSSNCNDMNLIGQQIGEPGQFQALPLNCYHCNDTASCANASASTISKCFGNENQTCTTAFGRFGSILARGCSDSLNDVCSNEDNNCYECKSNGCNNARQETDYINCIFCDAKQGDNCTFNADEITRTRKCHKSCVTALYPRFSDDNHVFDLTRTCTDDLDLDDREECASGASANCKSCNTEKCNTDLVGERKTCYQCKGDQCQDAVAKTCSAVADNDQCFMLYDETHTVVEMGCKSQYDTKELAILEKAKRIFLCNEDNCNTFEKLPEAQRCKLCNSLTDELCATKPDQVKADTNCNDVPFPQCYSRILADGHTERGCLSSLQDEQFVNCLHNANTSECLSCVGENCNRGLYPAERLSCNKCSSNSSNFCDASPKDIQICAKYSTEQKCVSKLTKDGLTIRGCSTEVTCEHSTMCETCSGDNCNSVNLKRKVDGKPGQWQPLPLKCRSCNSQTACTLEPRSEVCSDEEYCMTVFGRDGAVISRGCSNTVEAALSSYCDENSSNCHNCNSNDCNVATSQSAYIDCKYCDSETNADCVTDAMNVKTTRKCHKACMTALYPRAVNSTVYELKRSCLDDMDASAQSDCETGSNQNCKACSGDGCNTAELPEKRLNCYSCEGENCDDPTPTECASYKLNDQCFILFDNESNVKQLGCESSLSEDFLAENKHLMIRCNEADNCNFYDKLPAPNTCATCHSEHDPNCASDPSKIDSTIRCGAMPNTQCFTNVTKAGVTQRGCVSNLPKAQLIACLSGEANDCKICTGDKCNTDVFPADRRRCHQCNSKDSSTCATKPDDSAVCPVYSPMEFCTVKMVNDHTYRGCSSDFQCDVSDKKYCRHCFGVDNCNTANLIASDVGHPGKWQGLPLNCYTCTGEECISGKGKIQKCSNNDLQTCMSVFGADGSILARGCSDAVSEAHSEYCDNNAESCIACKSNGCNDADNLNQFTNCYFCESEEIRTCTSDFDSTTARTRKCQNGCMVALFPRSSAANTSYGLTRTCASDKDLDERAACIAGEDAYCQYCEGALCNTMDVPVDRNECYHCVDDDCVDAEPQKCSFHNDHDQCYTLYDKEANIIDMGCRSSFEPEAVNELVKQKLLLLCDGKNCNTYDSLPTAKLCSVCNSKTDPRCATNPNLVGNTTRCSALPYTQCVTYINEDGHTIRDCISTLDEETFFGCLIGTDKLCQACIGDKCNEIDIYPDNRLKCHQCTSASDPSCGNAPNSNAACPIYAENDTCVVNLRNSVTVRGCGSSLTCDNPDDKNTCNICSTPGCNTVNLEQLDEGQPGRWQNLPLNCISCEGKEECASGRVYAKCQNNTQQNCITVFDSTGSVIQRGCSDTVTADNKEYCEQNIGKCPRCNSNGCNEAKSLDDYVECLFCDAAVNANCLHDVSVITRTRQCHKHCLSSLYELSAEDNPAFSFVRSCADDMDLDEQEACAAGSNKNCQVCSDAKCNTVAIPTTRLSCNVCNGEDCQQPKQQTCVNYRQNDKCYIRFDEKRSIESMGCRSEFSNADADFLLMNKRMYYCEGDNCNTFDVLPLAQTCLLCNSRTDINCAIDPKNIKSTTNCAVLPYTGCYSRVLPAGETEKGCVSSLNDYDFLGCLNGTASTCEHCTGTNCNSEVFPINRLSCHVCDSSTNATCQANPSHMSICAKYAEKDTCVTAFINGVTKRGCSSSLECDSSNSRACVQCSGNGCNTINLSKQQDDNFGKWQDLPLKCLSCKDAECGNANTTLSATCENNNEQDCMTIFGADGEVTRRGCSDEVQAEYESYCDENADHCYSCKSNECNTAFSTAVFMDCLYCDSNKDVNCVRNPQSIASNTRKCQGGCMTALYPADSSSNPSYNTLRTCLSDKEAVDQASCMNGNDKHCNACTTASCNVEELPKDRLYCLSCSGDDCVKPQSLQCPLYKKDDMCFVWFDDTNSITEMGCTSSFRNQEIESIIKTKRVFVCEGKNCNNIDKLPTAQKCAVCDSQDDVHCATNAFEVGTFETCSLLPYSHCYSKLNMDGTTTRGCVTSLSDNDFAACILGTDENCGVCQGEACNREIFPANRLQCHTCTTVDDVDCESYPKNSLACPVVRDNEACVSALSGNNTVRGCSSQIYCDNTDKNTCRSCYGTNCNSIDLRNKIDDGNHGNWQELPLRCHTCNGTHCESSLGPAQLCTGNNAQDCMTVFNAAGQVHQRGCSDDIEDYHDLYCRQNPAHCFKCKSNECNMAWSLNDYVECAYCNSTIDAKCAVNPESSGFASRHCYKHCMVAMKEDVVVRTCLDDKELFVQNVCATEGGKECASCSSANCNKFVFPTDWLKCHVCTGNSCSSTQTQYCNTYKENDFCFAKYENGRVELMGCGSSQNASDIDDWTAQEKLYRCSENECNALDKLPNASVCVSCDSSKTPDCAQNPAAVNVTTTCGGPRGACLTRIDKAGDTVRSCLERISANEETSCKDAQTCSICTGHKCNAEIFPANRRKCFRCNSTTDKDCSKTGKNSGVCPKYVENEQCLSKKQDNFVQRGCVSDFIYSCATNDPNCKFCDSDNCNTDDLSGAAGWVKGSLTLTLLLAMVAIFASTN